MLALKGASADAEVARDAVAVRKLGGGDPRTVRCGTGLVDPPSTVVVVERARGAPGDDPAAGAVERNEADGRRPDARRGTPDEVSGPGGPRVDVPRGTSAYADWTPIAEEAARAARVLHPDRHRMPRPAAAPGADGREPEGRRRQDHQHRQHRRGAGACTGSRCSCRPRPAGQRQHRAGRRAPVGHAVGLRACCSARSRSPRRRRRARRRDRTCGACPATIDLAGAEIELVSMVARETRLKQALAPDGAATSWASTTSSSTARRRSAC